MKLLLKLYANRNQLCRRYVVDRGNSTANHDITEDSEMSSYTGQKSDENGHIFVMRCLELMCFQKTEAPPYSESRLMMAILLLFPLNHLPIPQPNMF